MFLGWSSSKIVQIVWVHWIIRSRGPKRGSENANFENLLLWNRKTQSFHIWYVASSQGPLQSLFKSCPWGQNWPRPRGHIFYIELYRKNFKNLLVKNGKPQSLHIWHVASSQGPLQRLFKLYPWGQNWGHNRGHHFTLSYIGKHLKIFLS